MVGHVAVAVPDSDEAGQNSLHGASVKRGELNEEVLFVHVRSSVMCTLRHHVGRMCFPEVHNYLFCLSLRISPSTVVPSVKCDDDVGVVCGCAVVRQQGEEQRTF